jgi:N-acetylglucosamine-6-phosphate deacetylase
MKTESVSFLDPQVNGYGGVDFQRDDLTVEDLRRAVRAWRRDGGSQFLLTLVTDAWPRMLARLRKLRTLRSADTELRDAIEGWHIEGPFLSEKPGFCGAHEPGLMQDAKPENIRELREAGGTDPMVLTLAPERSGAVEAIAQAVGLGLRVSLGHTDASADQLRAAVAAGATGFTHLGNGCPLQLDRHDNIIWRVLDTPGLVVGLIADRVHVGPALFRLIHRILPPERIYYTTDAMAAAGAAAGEFTLGRLRLRVGEDGIVRLPGSSHFAGSALRPSQLRERAAAMLGSDSARLLPQALGTAATWLGAQRRPTRAPTPGRAAVSLDWGNLGSLGKTGGRS